jgi:hypothetical protein
MKIIRSDRLVHRRRGAALIMMLLVVIGLAGLVAAMLCLNLSHSREQHGGLKDLHASYVCQAGLSQSMYQLQLGASGNVGTHTNPASWGGAQFWVQATPVTALVTRLTATGIDGRTGACQELDVRAVPNTIWRYGAFGREWMHMDSNARVDSYNSTLGTYAAQDVNGSGSNMYALANGDIGSNGDISLDQNANVWGDSIAGPSHTTTVLGNAAISGSTTPASQEITFPVINVPSYPPLGDRNITGNPTTFPTGNYNFANLTINSNKHLVITGPANIVCSNLHLNSNSDIVVNAAGGPVTFYVIDNFILDQNTTIHSTTFSPSDVAMNLLSDNVINPEINLQIDDVNFLSNSSVYGTILAPNARVVLNSNFQMYGALMARSLDVHSNARFHFDENLLNATANGIPTYETLCWRQLRYQP